MKRFASLPLLPLTLALGACGQSSSSVTTVSAPTAPAISAQATVKSAKRGIAYDLANTPDLAAVAPGVSWWYNWSPAANSGAPQNAVSAYGMDFVPMLWNGSFDTASIEGRLKANPAIKYLLVMNEPNLTDQSNLTPTQAADVWPRYEQVARDTGVKLVGPQLTWGTLSGYNDPVVWLDAFYSAYRTKNSGRDPQIDYLGFHWYDYGLAGQLDRLKKYGKPLWVTEFANWHTGDGSAQIDSVAKQKAQMADMVATLEARSDVFRYAWFTGRWNNDTHFTSLLGATGQLTELGQYYLSLPGAASTGGGSGGGGAATCSTVNLAQGRSATASRLTCSTVNLAQGRSATASSTENGGTPASAAVDGNTATRWASAFADPQWLQVDLGSVRTLCQVKLQWEAAYGKAFQIQVSSDGAAWTTLYQTASGAGGTQTLTVSGSGRYVRVYGTARATGYGYSLYEFGVYGTP